MGPGALFSTYFLWVDAPGPRDIENLAIGGGPGRSEFPGWGIYRFQFQIRLVCMFVLELAFL